MIEALHKPEIQHVAIAGNIGAGKTTLCKLLARHYNWEVHFEDTEENPYLSNFYEDMKRWAFNLQIYFLNSRYRQVLNIQRGGKTVIQDRTIYEDAYIFAPNLYEMGLMPKRDFDNYFSLFQLMSQHVRPPDILIYLRASIPTLVGHIGKRGRDYESSMSIEYLKRLNERYERWVSTYDIGNLLIIDVDNIDFENRVEDKATVINMVDANIHGLFRGQGGFPKL